MKRILFAAALGVSFAGLFAAPSQARTFCERYPDHPDCVDDGSYDDGGYGNDGYGNDGYGNDADTGNTYSRRGGREVGSDNGVYASDRGYRKRGGSYPRWNEPRQEFRSCGYVARWLTIEYGYRGVRPDDCSGQNYKFTGWRGRHAYSVKVDAKRMRVMYELRVR